MFAAVVGHSDEFDTDDALAAVLGACDARLAGRAPCAGVVFCGTEFDHGRVLAGILARFPGLQLVGCTTDGEMSDQGGYTEDGITLTLFLSDRVRIGAGVGCGAGADPLGASRAAIAMARAQLDGEPCLALVMPDGLTARAYDVLAGFNDVLGDAVPVVGGMSADRVGGAKASYATYQFCGDQVYSDAVPTLLFSGPLAFSLGVESGWTPIGKRMTVTRAENNVLHELDHRPAFELYTHYLGEVMRENLAGLGSYPLAVYEPGLERFYLRVARSADPATGRLTFLGEIPVGAEVQITQAIRDEVIGGVQQSVSKALAAYPGDAPGAALMFSCTGRKVVLGTKARDEIGRARASLLRAIPMSGFYTFGEIGPVSQCTRARYHNTTFVTLLLGEA